ncbi:MAG: hypothetical protein ABL949_03290 [Fimbriimonadaceae bacterium]
MEPLARWIRKEINRELPWPYIAILALTIPPCGAIPALSIFTSQNPNAGYKIMGLLLLAVAGIIPTILHMRKNRHRPKMVPLLRAHFRGNLASEIGPKAEHLNRAAADLEQITVSLENYHSDAIKKKPLVLAAEARMRRSLELTVGAPANYGLTQDQAVRQIEADCEWLSHARKICERLTLPTAEHTDDTILSELQELAEARDQAIEELKLRG